MIKPINPFTFIPPPGPVWITINELCRKARICRTTAHKLIKEDRFVVKRIGRAVRILDASVESYFRQTEDPLPPAEDVHDGLWEDREEDVLSGLDDD